MRAILAACLLSAIAFCQEQDVDGWSKAKWGMTELEVMSALKDQQLQQLSADDPASKAHSPGPLYVPFKFVGVNIDGRSFEARCNFAKSTGRLESITLSYDRSNPHQSGLVMEGLFEIFEGLLIEKYGVPTTVKNTSSTPEVFIGRERVWRFKSGIITLLYSRARSLDGKLMYLNIQYRKRGTVDNL